ncbi:c-type cytochrome [Neoaquamicrobium sediminum]|jgi:mono/diheme cytochrome c family protein|uniref:Cytochrome c n=1 Tax=Neoaquamicrobium sediminum TaxID=1849104 RepID=A0ABV3X2T7_9HYPH|nr:cytochrome c [Mesorhizobium sediminum]NRC56382.1 c-type cytochrome [Mesorhizobium sediminum]
MNKTLVAVVAVVLAGVAIWWAQNRQDGSGSGEPIVQVIVPSSLSSMAEQGKTAFDANCASCHGPNGSGRDGLAPPLIHKIYEPSHHSDMAFTLAVRQGVRAHHWRFGSMAPIEGVSDASIEAITTYIRELQRANDIH